MKRAALLAVLGLGLALPGRAEAAGKLRVVASIPDLADIARRVGGEEVQVESIARGTEDIHQVTMRPSFVTKLNRADAVVFLGLTLEHSFLPGLLEAARNNRAKGDAERTCIGEACIDCSEGVEILDKPRSLSRAEGELHPHGNPHYNTNPENGAVIARNIFAGLSRLRPESKELFAGNLKAYLAELEPKVAEWRKRAGALKGVKAVSYHKDVAYIGRFTGIEFLDTIELKPGIAPTPSHLDRLVKKMKEQGVRLIVREQQYDHRTCEWLAAQTGARIAVVSTMAGAFKGADTFISFSEHNLQALIDAASKAAP